jgi:uncharacterized protein (TIGR02145 family)
MLKVKFLLLFMSFFLIGKSQTVEKRIALLIGNSNYKNGTVLKTPSNDASLMANTLEGLGFTVVLRNNASREEMISAISSFYNSLSDSKVALFYYSGHGMLINGVNFVIPVDAEIKDENMASFEAISVNDIVKKLESYPQNINIVILDACRSNPFRSWLRGNQLGFSAMNPGPGTIIAFAASEGQTTSDGVGANGLYTEKLVKQMTKPIPIESVFKNTRLEVQKASNNIQIPQEWTQLTGEFYFPKVTNPIAENSSSSNDSDSLLKSSKALGKIKLNTEIGGDLYMDNTIIGRVEANSSSNILDEIPFGTHVFEIKGDPNWKYELTVKDEKLIELTVSINKNIFFDSRDNRTYKTVKIGEQVWMAENLNYEIAVEKEKGVAKLFSTKPPSNYCYDGNLINCSILGRLYLYETAKNACPTGWHLPNEKEWQTLIINSGGESGAPEKLKPANGWVKSQSSFFSNKTTWTFPPYEGGFAALPGGSSAGGLGYYTSWWVQTPAGSKLREVNISDRIKIDNAWASNSLTQKTIADYVRCIKD